MPSLSENDPNNNIKLYAGVKKTENLYDITHLTGNENGPQYFKMETPMSFPILDSYSKTEALLWQNVKKTLDNWFTPSTQKQPQVEKSQQWYDVLSDWFLEKGPSIHYYTEKDQVTKDLMKDESIQYIRKRWAEKGKHSHDVIPYNFSVPEYIRELATLDGTGSFIGSYKAHIDRLPNGKNHYKIKNETGWESGTRSPIPSTKQWPIRDNPSWEDLLTQAQHRPKNVKEWIQLPFKFIEAKSILSNKNRPAFGPGGTHTQYYEWDE